MSSDDLNSTNRGLVTGFPWKMLSDWPLRVVRTLLYLPLLGTTNLWKMPTDPMVEDMYRGMILGILGIVGNAGCLAQWC